MYNYRNIDYFKGLYALRFFAALLVLLNHAEIIRAKNRLPNFKWMRIPHGGENGVNFLFVLSGFLITYLLLKESNSTGTVNIRYFYLRRILRVWPLYYLLVIIGTLVMPILYHTLYPAYKPPFVLGQVWYYYVFFLPGFVTFLFGFNFLSPLWTIGVEEVFYLIWAPLFKLFKRNILFLLLAVFFIKVTLIAIAHFYIRNKIFVYLVNVYSFEHMAIGGLGAYFLFNRQKPVAELAIYNRWAQLVVYAILVAHLAFISIINYPLWTLIFKTAFLSKMLIDFTFLYLIIGVSVAENSIIKLNSKVLNYLGDISYGIYMYHMLALFVVVVFLKKYLLSMDPLLSTAIFYTALVGIVLMVSALSKAYYENYFLRLKRQLRPPLAPKT